MTVFEGLVLNSLTSWYSFLASFLLPQQGNKMFNNTAFIEIENIQLRID